MLLSPFTFSRGAAKIMAADFGAFASPERRLLFDLNDFDETLPGPFEYDLKRMAASLRAVRSVLPSPDPGLGTFPVLAVLFLGVAVAPSPEG